MANSIWRGGALILCAGLAGCGQPSWRDPATAKGTAAVAPEVMKIVLARGGVAKPKAPARLTTTDPVPPPPAWAANLIGKPLAAAFPKLGGCLGNTDGVKQRYVGPAPGAKVVGWGWDPARASVVPHVVVVDRNAVIAGAGDSGARRLDVPQARPDITSDHAGWEVYTPLTTGPLEAYGVLADGKTICRLGHLDL
ncbi:MAG: hypothetical protein E7812_01065 [Phenylobacterium sp.]|nr:MAG: hypothetical protein E7812_01065 [Phenylobacterium sp.]